MRLAVVVVIACGCSSDRPSRWWLQSEWGGGKPPGNSHRTTLSSAGAFRATTDHVTTCEVTLPAANLDAITKALAEAKLEPGLPAEKKNADLVSRAILTIDAQPYAMPSTPAFDAAVAAAMAVAMERCPKPR